MKTALVLLANGCEEMEAVITIDVLRRAEVKVVTAGLDGEPVVASRGVGLVPDIALDQVEDAAGFDLLVLPGGMGGTHALAADERVLSLVRRYDATPGKRLASICAAALVLDAAGILEGRSFTCYPTVADQITHETRLGDRVVVDGDLITSQGPGTAFDFALTLVRELQGQDPAREVAKGMLQEWS